MADGPKQRALPSRGWVFRNIFWRTTTLGLLYGAAFGALFGGVFGVVVGSLYGVFIGALFGMVIGGALGLCLGIPLGPILAVVTTVWFYPLTNAVMYRRGIAVIGVALCFGSCWVVFGLLFVTTEDGFNGPALAAACLAAVAAWLASRRLADWYASVMRPDTIVPVLWNNECGDPRPQENADIGENGKVT